jgi:hypothetical protein
MRAFIVRPFGHREGIDFDKVESVLIQPALTHQNIDGGTTGLILEAGNIREDMFQQLLVADLVIADISIHNANVFYELGVRHALQPRHTFLIRAKNTKPRAERGPQDEVPFDLKTDRYLEYDPHKPEATLGALIDALAATRVSKRADSPVFLLLPNLEAQDRSRFLTVPLEFGEAVEHASKTGERGRLGLLGLEARGQTWESEGLRLVGREQFNCNAYAAARLTWEAVRKLDSEDVEANLTLGTIYQKLRDLDRSNQALERVVSAKRADQCERAEAMALLARNTKERWRRAWMSIEDLTDRRVRALRSPDMLEAYTRYSTAYRFDLNHYYSGLNALGLLTVGLSLAKDMPEIYAAFYDSDAEAAAQLERYAVERMELAAAVGLSLDAAEMQNRLDRTDDRWLNASMADLSFLTSTRTGRVRYLYERAVASANPFEIESMRNQLELFSRLDVLAENVEAALQAFPPPIEHNGSSAFDTVIVFTGHMIDAPGRPAPRFPTDCVPIAKQAIRQAVAEEIARAKNGRVVGIAGGSCGGDLLFHESCAELNVPTELYLPVPPNVYRTESVRPGGDDWVSRFDALLKQRERVPVLGNPDELPPWLASRPGYAAWQRANLWLLSEALAKDAPSLQVIALWDGEAGDGPGGTEHLMRLAREHDAGTVHLKTKELFTSSARST